MVAPVAKNGICLPGSNRERSHRASPVCEWRLVDHFNTVEEAERVLDKLRRKGVEAELSLIDGLSVIARRSVLTCDPSRC